MNQQSKPAILIVTIEFPPLPGGIGNHAYNLAKQFASANHPVTVLTEYRANSEEQWSDFVNNIPGVTVIGIRRNKLILLTYIKRILTFRNLSKQHEVVIFSGKFSIWLAGINPSKNRSIAVIHGSEIKLKGILHSLFQRGLNAMDHIISVSNFTQKKLINAYEISEEKCSVINNGFTPFRNTSYIKQAPNKKAPVFITIGSMHKRKGQHNFIATIPHLLPNYPDLKYIIAGIPSEMNWLQNLANELNVSRHIEFIDTPTTDDVVTLLERATIFMMLSENLDNGDFEGFGIAILEAMYMKLPAIGSVNTGIEDAISDNYSGILVDAHSTEQIVRAVDSILSDYDSYAQHASDWSEQFLWNNIIGKYLAIVNK